MKSHCSVLLNLNVILFSLSIIKSKYLYMFSCITFPWKIQFFPRIVDGDGGKCGVFYYLWNAHEKGLGLYIYIYRCICISRTRNIHEQGTQWEYVWQMLDKNCFTKVTRCSLCINVVQVYVLMCLGVWCVVQGLMGTVVPTLLSTLTWQNPHFKVGLSVNPVLVLGDLGPPDKVSMVCWTPPSQQRPNVV